MGPVIDITQRINIRTNLKVIESSGQCGEVLAFDNKDKIDIKDSHLSFNKEKNGSIPFLQYKVGNVVWFISFTHADVYSIIIKENSNDMDYDKVDFEEFKGIKKSILDELERVNISRKDKGKIVSKLKSVSRNLEATERKSAK